MDMELNEKEIEALKVLLETRIAAIGPEIHHTDTPSYREALRQSRELLTGILERLSKPEAIRM
jgi:hypothetical protein